MQNSSQADTPTTRSKVKLLLAGFGGGFLQAGLFNPWDRALYLSIKDQRPFLSVKNFQNPWAGVSQTIVQRAISAGMYFPLEEIFADKLVSSQMFGHSSDELAQNRKYIALFSGLLAGMTNGLLMNPLAAIKYNFWGRAESNRARSFLDAAREMNRKGGLRIYYVGASATVGRDLVFGAFYGVLRHELPYILRSTEEQQKFEQDGRLFATAKPSFAENLVAAMVATVLSSPWNYVRNVHYATPYGRAPESARKILGGLWSKAKLQPTLFAKLVHLQTQLRVGWGTARVGAGMAFSAQVYQIASRAMD